MSINIHPATVHFPIAFLLLASGAGLLYLYWRPLAVLHTLMWWPMRLGWLATLVAILTGLLAQSPLPPQAGYRPLLNWHITTGLALWVLYGLILYWQWLLHSRSRRRKGATPAAPADLLQLPAARVRITFLLLLGIALILASGWNGGQLVYQWGVNVLQ